MVDIGNGIKLSVDELNGLSDEKVILLRKLLGGKSTGQKKASVSYAPHMKAEVWKNTDGVECVRFVAPDFATRSRTVEEMRTNDALYLKKQFKEPGYLGSQFLKGTGRPCSVKMVEAFRELKV
jgi:hypothetical protein